MSQGKAVIKTVLFSLGTFLIVSCVHDWEQPLHSVTNYFAREKFDLNVALLLNDELRDTKWERKAAGETWIIPFGANLTHNTKRIANHLFSRVVVWQNATDTSQAGVDAILTPRVLFVEQSLGVWKWSESILSMGLEWDVKDAAGNTIWVDTVKGEGKGEKGNVFTSKQETQKRVRLLLDDIFQKSFHSISSSVSLKEFEQKTLEKKKKRKI